KTAAGAVDNVTFEAIPDQGRSQLSILAKTEVIPRQMVLVRSGLDPALVDAIKALMMDLDKQPEGPDILKAVLKTKKFNELPNGTDGVVAGMKELSDVVNR